MTESTFPQDQIAAAAAEATNKVDEQRTYLALPPSVEGLLAQRNKPQKATLHDRVEAIYLGLYANEEFRRLREPVYREQAVEGDLRDDDARAAMMIREEAKRKGDLMVAKEKLATIRRSILVVETRYNATRRQRLAISES